VQLTLHYPHLHLRPLHLHLPQVIPQRRREKQTRLDAVVGQEECTPLLTLSMMSKYSISSPMVLPTRACKGGRHKFLLGVWIQEIATNSVMSSQRSAYHREDKTTWRVDSSWIPSGYAVGQEASSLTSDIPDGCIGPVKVSRIQPASAYHHQTGDDGCLSNRHHCA